MKREAVVTACGHLQNPEYCLEILVQPLDVDHVIAIWILPARRHGEHPRLVCFRQHLKESANASHFRFLSCVSDALWSERGESRTLFSAENIIETYFALAGREGERASGVQRACELLNAYQSRLEQARVERNILQRNSVPLNPEDVWHSILLDSVRKQSPKQNAAVGVRRDQERYCLFANQCRTAENSPFAGR